MALSDFYPVSYKGAGQLIVASGSGSFFGNDTNTVLLPVLHGIGSAPVSVAVMPALVAPGATFWAAQIGQYAAADNTNFYIGFYVGTFTFGSSYEYFFGWEAKAVV